MRFLATCSLICLLGLSSLADDIQFKDLPTGHWAEKPVYELVKLGVTSGFPDGTFRGNRPITRYETAAFLSKLAQTVSRQHGRNEKLAAELKNEINTLKYERETAAKETRISGSFEPSYRAAVASPRGGVFDYRLKWTLARNFDIIENNASLKINFDSLDLADRSLSQKNFDAEGKIKWGKTDWTMTVGPSKQKHTDPTGLFPSENNMYFSRPDTGLKVATKYGALDLSAGIVTRQKETSGLILIPMQEWFAQAGYDFGLADIYIKPRFYYVSATAQRDLIADLGLNIIHGVSETRLLYSVGAQTADGTYMMVEEKIIDPWQTGTNATVRYDQVGAHYRVVGINETIVVPINQFGRLRNDGENDLGVTFSQKLGKEFSINVMRDAVSGQYALDYQTDEKMVLSAYYRTYYPVVGAGETTIGLRAKVVY